MRKARGEMIPQSSFRIYNLFYGVDSNACRIEPIFMENSAPPEPVLISRRDLCKYNNNKSISKIIYI